MSNLHHAIVSRTTPNGFGYIVDKNSGKEFSFTFDKIKNYRGESAKELGLLPGVVVHYQQDLFGNAKDLEVIPDASGPGWLKKLYRKNPKRA